MNGAAPSSPDGGSRAVRMSAPVLRTGDLELPLVGEADLEDLFTLHADPAAFAHDTTAPLPARGQMAWVLRQWQEHAAPGGGAGYRTVREHDGGACLGVVGLAPLDTEQGPVLSAYWRITPAAQGRGVASAAMRAVLAACPGPEPEVVAVTHVRNAPSLALARRLGFLPAPPERPVPSDRRDDVLLLLPPARRGPGGLPTLQP